MCGEGEQWGSMGLNHVWGERREGTGGALAVLEGVRKKYRGREINY